MSRQFPVKGTRDILANLTALGSKIEKQAVRSGLTSMAGVIRDEARARAPKQSGQMAKAIRSGSANRNEDGSYSIRVYVDERKPDGFLGYFHEYGVKEHLIASTGAGEGRVAVRKARAGTGTVENGVMKIGDDYVSGIIDHPGHAAQPFMLPALDTKGQEAVEAFRQRIIAVVEGKTGFNMAAEFDEAA